MSDAESKELPTCPHCDDDADEASCPHLLVRIDETFGEMKGDAWWDIAAPAFEALDEAARQLVVQLPKLSDKAQSRVHTHLSTRRLTESFQFLADEMKNGDGMASIRGNADRGWYFFLHRLLEDVAEPEESQAEGGRGMTRVETFYWAADAKQAAEDFAEALREEARALEALGAAEPEPARKSAKAGGKKSAPRPKAKPGRR